MSKLITKFKTKPLHLLCCAWFLGMMLKGGEVMGQSVGDYRSKATGNWNAAATWETWNGSAWVESGTPTSANGAITIRDGHTVTVTAAATVDQVVIEAGGIVRTLPLASGTITLTVANGSGNDLVVFGTFTSNSGGAISISSGANIVFEIGGVYEHNRSFVNGIPSATWQDGSSCRITDDPASLNSTLNQNFYNLEFNWTSGTTARTMEVTAPSQVRGTFKVEATGTTGSLLIGNGSTSRSLTVNNFEITGGNFYVAGASASNEHTLTVNGNFTQTGGNFEVCRTNNAGTYSATINGTATFSGGNARIMNNSGTGGRAAALTIVGNTTINGGTLDLSAAGSTNTGRLFLRNNLNLSSGGLIFTQAITGGSSGVYFDRNGGAQTFTWSGGTLSTASGGIGRRFYFRNSSGPADLNEVYSANTAQETVNGSQGAPTTNYAAWPTTGTVIKNLTIDNPAGVTLSTVKTVNETLTLTNGAFTLSNTLTIANGASIVRSGGSLSAAPTFGTSVNVTYAQHSSSITTGVELPSSSTVLNNLTINTTNGVTLNDSRRVNGTLFLSNGRLNTGACNSATTSATLLTLADNATVSGASTSSYVNGVMRKIGDDAFTFPVGDALEFAPIGISAPIANTDEFGACYTRSTALDISSNIGVDIVNISDCEHWFLNRHNGNSSALVTLSWDMRSCGVTDPSELLVVRYNGTNWESLGNSETTGNNSSGTITSNTVNSFSPFTLGSSTANNPLPVELTDFNAHCSGNSVELSWTTASEYNASHYNLEKSIDGYFWNIIAQIDASGTTNQTSHYTYLDRQNSNLSYYRLIQFDFDGASDSLKTISSACEWENHRVSVLPNPNNGEFTISGLEEGVIIQIINIMGQVVYEETASSNFSVIQLGNTHKGIFFLRSQTDQVQTVTKFIIK
jgi:hypothetical protein